MLTAVSQSPARQVPCEKCPLRGQPALRDFSPEELDFIASFKSGELTAQAGTTLLMQGAASGHLYTVLSGWAFRHKTLADGRRQILNFALPADFIGLQGTVLGEMQHSVEALTAWCSASSRASGCGNSTAAIPRSPSTSPGSPRAKNKCSTSI